MSEIFENRIDLKAKLYCNIKERLLKFVTEDNKEYIFTDFAEATRYFEGLGYLDVRITELFLTVPEFDKTFHYKERHDPRARSIGLAIDDFILECVTPITKEEAKLLHEKYFKNFSYMYTHADPFII